MPTTKKTAKQQAAEDAAAHNIDRQIARALARGVEVTIRTARNPNGHAIVSVSAAASKTPARRAQRLTLPIAADSLLLTGDREGVVAYTLWDQLNRMGVPS